MKTSWWMWVGGRLGTFYVWSTIFATPKIGASLALALMIAGQVLGVSLVAYAKRQELRSHLIPDHSSP
jgi:transporter family-2 protein